MCNFLIRYTEVQTLYEFIVGFNREGINRERLEFVSQHPESFQVEKSSKNDSSINVLNAFNHMSFNCKFKMFIVIDWLIFILR